MQQQAPSFIPSLFNTSRRLRGLLLPYAVVLLCALAVKLSFSRESIYFFVNGLHFRAGDIFFPLITELGSTVAALGLCVLLLLFFSYRSSLLLGSSYMLTTIINSLLKYLFAAPRPKLYFEDYKGPLSIYYVPDVTVLANHFSFPSGHTVCAFTSAAVLTYIAPRRWPGAVYLLLAMLVAYSRMYMSHHFFEDVTTGSVVAVVLTTVWLAWFGEREFLRGERWNRGLL